MQTFTVGLISAKSLRFQIVHATQKCWQTPCSHVSIAPVLIMLTLRPVSCSNHFLKYWSCGKRSRSLSYTPLTDLTELPAVQTVHRALLPAANVVSSGLVSMLKHKMLTALMRRLDAVMFEQLLAGSNSLPEPTIIHKDQEGAIFKCHNSDQSSVTFILPLH